jgi:hypothetical protein
MVSVYVVVPSDETIETLIGTPKNHWFTNSSTYYITTGRKNVPKYKKKTEKIIKFFDTTGEE